MHRVVASSVRGPGHVRDGLPCQDAWLAVTPERGCFAVVCDGLGSRPNSRAGAQAAVRAARDAWRAWARSEVGSGEDLIRYLEVAWRLRLGKLLPADAATTCLLYGEDGRGRSVTAQLGDGLIARRLTGNRVEVHTEGGPSFNATHCLGSSHRLSDWRYSLGRCLQPGEAVCMATDGVSEDLDPEGVGPLIQWVMTELGQRLDPGRALRRELEQWPVPKHQDDKTLLVMWKL